MLLQSAWWDDALGGLVALPPEDTGLDFWVWCSPGSADVRVVVTPLFRLLDGEWSTVALHPALHVVDGEPLSGHDLDRLARWRRANGTTVERYWRQDVVFAQDFLRALMPVVP